MPPKKKKEKPKDDEGDPGLSPATLLANYVKFSKLVCVPVHPRLVEALSSEEKAEEFVKSKQLIFDDEKGVLGPAGTRCLCTAILGTAPGMVPCRLVKCLRFWRCDVNDDGAACIAELLRLGGAEVALTYLELLDNNIGPQGAKWLGQSLSFGQNKSLQTLKLDYNFSLGSEGVAALCTGLRTNSTLKQLHLPYCRIDADGGAPLGELLSYRQSALQLLNLQGNQLGGKGLASLCDGLVHNLALTSLSVADNGIGQTEEDLEAVKKLGHTIMLPTSPLAAVDLLFNRLGEQGGQALLAIFKGKAPSKVKQLLVDSTLPQQLFDHLCKIDAAGGGGKKKGKKGKKKK